MKALILAAGLGSRLAPLTDKMPKSLVTVNGIPILSKQIENLHQNNIYDITVVSGYKADVLEEFINKNWNGINIVKSINYENTNNMYSAYLGISEMLRGNGEDCLMMNADVFYDDSIIKSLISCEAENAIAVDIGRYIDESMKVVEKHGKLTDISKQISPSDALGCSIDVYKFSAKAIVDFYECCKDYIENKKELKLWSEVALKDILDKDDFYACPILGRWLEIDNHDDLAAAEELFSE